MGNIIETSIFEKKIMEEYTKGINHFKDEKKLYEALEKIKDLNLTPNMIKRLLITFFIIKKG